MMKHRKFSELTRLSNKFMSTVSPKILHAVIQLDATHMIQHQYALDFRPYRRLIKLREIYKLCDEFSAFVMTL